MIALELFFCLPTVSYAVGLLFCVLMDLVIVKIFLIVFLLLTSLFSISSSFADSPTKFDSARKYTTDSDELSKDLQMKLDKYLLVIDAQRIEINQLKKNQLRQGQDINGLQATSRGEDFSSWISVLLGCVAILITVLGVLIGLISFVGYKNFKESTKEAAENISETTATTVAEKVVTSKIDSVAKVELARLIDNGHLSKHLESAVDVILRREYGGSSLNKYPELDDGGNE